MSSDDQSQILLVTTVRDDDALTNPGHDNKGAANVGRLTALAGSNPGELQCGISIAFSLTGNDGAYFLPWNEKDPQNTVARTNHLGFCDVTFGSAQGGTVTLNASLFSDSSTQAQGQTFEFKLPPQVTNQVISADDTLGKFYWRMTEAWCGDENIILADVPDSGSGSKFKLTYITSQTVKICLSDEQYLVEHDGYLVATGDFNSAIEFTIGDDLKNTSLTSDGKYVFTSPGGIMPGYYLNFGSPSAACVFTFSIDDA